MSKKLIAAAIAAVVAAPMAASADSANVTVYGKVHVSIDKVDTDTTDNFQVSSNASRLGFKGTEDLGNGLKAIWQYEMAYDVTDGGGIGGARNSFLGLSGNWGTFLAGRHDTPAKVAFYAAGNEVIGDSIVDLNTSMGFEEVRASNAYAYISPNFSGLTVAIAGVAGENVAGSDQDGIADAWSIGLMYSGMGVKAGIGYTDHLDNIPAVAYEKLNVGGSYTMGPLKAGLQYQQQEQNNTSVETDIWAVQGQYSFGNNTVGLSYGQNETDGQADAETWNLSLNHKFSKRTSAYVAYSNRDVDGGGTTTTVAGDSITDGDAFSVGMIHSF